MVAIAVIGGDGAGKTTVTRRLLDDLPFPVRYLYMGINTESSSVALPTSRFLERRRARRRAEEPPGPSPASRSGHGRRRRKGKLRATVRLAHRLADESYRQLHSWWYQIRGSCVLYDRHFLFDFFEEPDGEQRLSDRLHLGFLRRVYPRPDLVIFLDAPAEVLYARKPEAPLEYLRNHREAVLRRGAEHEAFVRVDATRSLEEVYADVRGRIEDFVAGRRVGTPAESQIR